jgi:hypothetical protein
MQYDLARAHVETIIAHDHHGLRQGIAQKAGFGGTVGYRRIGNTGDAIAGQQLADWRHIDPIELPRCSQPGVTVPEVPAGVGQAGPVATHSVEHPELAAAMLDTDRAVIHHRVKETPVEGTGDRLVIPDTPQPACGPDQGGGPAQHGGKGGLVTNRRRPAPHRLAGGGDGKQMNVMIVKSRQEGPAIGVDDRVLVATSDVVSDASDPLAADLHVDQAVALDLRPDDQDVQVATTSSPSFDYRRAAHLDP